MSDDLTFSPRFKKGAPRPQARRIFDPPISVLVVNEEGLKDTFEDVTAVLIGHGGSLNVQRDEDATLYRKWQSWKVL